jgi:hypothetical protein
MNSATTLMTPHNTKGRDFTPETDGEAVCPQATGKAFVREWDNGDVTAPLRSCQRATAWEDAHKKAGKVLHNVGYVAGRFHVNCRLVADLALEEV